MDFLDELENNLTKYLTDAWEIKNKLKEDIFEKWKRFYIAKKEWKENYSIGIGPEYRQAKGYIIGVKKQPESEPFQGGKLTTLLNENYRQGKCSKKWEWQQWLDSPYLNWDNEEALIKMYRKDEAVNYFKENFLRIKEIVSPLIDEKVKFKQNYPENWIVG